MGSHLGLFSLCPERFGYFQLETEVYLLSKHLISVSVHLVAAAEPIPALQGREFRKDRLTVEPLKRAMLSQNQSWRSGHRPWARSTLGPRGTLGQHQ